MKRKLPFIVALVLTILVSSTVAFAQPLIYKAHLSAEAPGVVTLAQGQAIFKLDDDANTVTYRLIVANIEDVTMAHIHIAPPGSQNGPPVIWLYPSAPPAVKIPGRSQGTLAMGTITLTDAAMANLLTAIEEGRAYVNVHTTAYPGGEIRGTIW